MNPKWILSLLSILGLLFVPKSASSSSGYFAEGGRGILDDEEESIRQALEKRNLQEGGRGILDDEEESIRQALEKRNLQAADKRSKSGVLSPLAVDKTKPSGGSEDNNHHQQVTKEAKQAGKRGQIEYPSFLEPEPVQNNRQISRQEADILVKRAEGSPFLDEHEYITKDLLGALSASITIVVAVAAVAGIAVSGTVWYRMNKQRGQAVEAHYPHYGGTGPSLPKRPSGSGGSSGKRKSPTQAGDASLAYSAQLHHFEQTKQKILSQGQAGAGEGGTGESDDESGGENDEGDYSVYECPGLAPTGDIEVSNPLFENSTKDKSTLNESD